MIRELLDQEAFTVQSVILIEGDPIGVVIELRTSIGGKGKCRHLHWYSLQGGERGGGLEHFPKFS